jgi:response regulator RpfG family c-di-GMP phosphodiesterase
VHIIDAVNKGEIFRYISKPWDQEELIMTVKNAVERYNILSEFNRYKNEKQVPDQKGVELFRQCSEEITACIEDMKIQQKAYLESAEKLAHTLKSVSEKMSDAPDH